jgi:hypothetical protein
MAKFRKKPVEIEAVQWNGTRESFEEIRKLNPAKLIVWYVCHDFLNIPTDEGDMTAHITDWIIRGVNGEMYPCKNDVFEKTYEEVK